MFTESWDKNQNIPKLIFQYDNYSILYYKTRLRSIGSTYYLTICRFFEIIFVSTYTTWSFWTKLPNKWRTHNLDWNSPIFWKKYQKIVHWYWWHAVSTNKRDLSRASYLNNVNQLFLRRQWFRTLQSHFKLGINLSTTTTTISKLFGHLI